MKKATLSRELTTWLNGNREFRGHISRIEAPAADGHLSGGIISVLEVALGSGGAGVVLAQSLGAWLRNQRSDITITVMRDHKKVEVSARRVSDPESLLRKILDVAWENDGTDGS